MSRVKQIAPGFLACLVIAWVAQMIGSQAPQIGAALFAILLGMACGNTFLNQKNLDVGVKFSESKLLEISIALTGLTLNVMEVMAIGWYGGLFIVLQMTLTIVAVFMLGQLLGFTRKFSLLMCAGNAVCGSSAIGTVSPILGADEKDKGISITTVNLTGTVLMVFLPILTGWLYQHDTVQTSAMIGGTLQSIGQVIASAKLVNDDVTQFATVFKLLRIVLLVVVAMVFSKINTAEDGPLFRKETDNVTKRVGIPWFILTFMILCLVVTLVSVPLIISVVAKKISNQFEIIALAGIGMRVKFKDLVREGPRSMMFGLLTGGMQIGMAWLLIKWLF
ncbi:YeiH family protein [Vagococcus lutrae]|uniref:YeiH family protein n=1 Tax=Vagococcus lutrae TaxID=81947 RepID=UPI00200CB945|nr:putative sulfate exporter family transporter [Vagococcus lutrae]UQF11325.1 putative sulfate exporter family transporter [Vagococcus lutrae]